MTPEQQANVDKALANTSLSKDIGPATDVPDTLKTPGPDLDPTTPTTPTSPTAPGA
jgi:hypothetical protein